MKNADGSFGDLGIAFAVVLSVAVCAIFFLPILPIDETRSLSVAWEMWLHKSFLVPLLNGQPYAHKPPLLFWLIHLTWWVFGVNDLTPRLIPVLFSLGNLLLLYRISRHLWPRDGRVGNYAVLLLSATFIYLVWSFLILYEILLTFWVLVSVLGALSAYRNGGYRGWVGVALGIAGGILTKGPVVLVHVLPLLIMAFWWGTFEKRAYLSWLAKALAALIAGIFVSCLWVVPAAIQGGAAYRHAILWRQTAERVVTSFAHQRPFWWYLPLLPALFLPWVFVRVPWRGLSLRNESLDEGERVCLTWFLASLVIFSLVSGKQIYYLIPSLPAVTLLLARNLAGGEEAGRYRRFNARGFGMVLALLGGFSFFLPVVSLSQNTGRLPWRDVLPIGSALLILGVIFLARKFKSARGNLRGVGVCVAIILCLFMATTGRDVLRKYDLKPLARLVRTKMDAGDCVAFIGGYHGEFQFLGRLKRPIVELTGDKFKKYLRQHPDCFVIDTIRTHRATRLKNVDFCYIHPFREQRMIIMVKGETYLDHFSEGQ